MQAVAFRRRTLAVPNPPKKPWTKAQDKRIRETATWPIKKMLKVFPGRTAIAIGQRRQRLGCAIRAGNPWIGTEVKLLREIWADHKLSDILNRMPRHTLTSIKDMAGSLGLRKARTIDHVDMLEQIRLRAREDRINGKKLVAEVGCGNFIFRRRSNSRMDYNQIAKVVDFFGGRLTIDWCDE